MLHLNVLSLKFCFIDFISQSILYLQMTSVFDNPAKQLAYKMGVKFILQLTKQLRSFLENAGVEAHSVKLNNSYFCGFRKRVDKPFISVL